MTEIEVKELLYEMIDADAKRKNEIFDILENLEENEYKYLIFPKVDIERPTKVHWRYGAQVIVRIGYPRIKSIMNLLLEFFQDLNWPGAGEVYEYLTNIDKELLIPHIEVTLVEAEADSSWLYFLGNFFEYNNYSEKDFSVEVRHIFRKAVEYYESE